MSLFLGIDTSNYTTSAALYDDESRSIREERQLLRVKDGEKGLRQSDAVYQHVKNLPVLIGQLLKEEHPPILAVGVSAKPREAADSYMPCFEAGIAVAHSMAAALRVPYKDFSHQAGHIASALFSINRLELMEEPFIAFHVSGGTTEAVLCTPDGVCPKTEVIARSLDLKAGQAVDRVGLMLSLPFPAGPALEKLAFQSERKFDPVPCMKGADCCLSGVENLCARMLESGSEPSDVARFCLDYVKASLDGMTRAVRERYPGLPLLYAGGVMSDSIIKEYFVRNYGALFARRGFSSDNACGIAVLAGRSEQYAGTLSHYVL